MKTGGEPNLSILRSLAKQCLEESNNNPDQAYISFKALVKSQPALFRAVAEPLVDDALYEMLHLIIRGHNGIVWNGERFPGGGPKLVTDTAAALLYSLLDGFIVMGIGPLGDLTKEQVQSAVEFYHKQSIDMEQKSKFLQLVADKMADDKTVRQCIDEKTARALQRKACK